MKQASLLVIAASLLLIPVAAFAQVGSDASNGSSMVTCPPGVSDGNCMPGGPTSAAPAAQTVVPSPQGAGVAPAPQGAGITAPASAPAATTPGGQGQVTNPLGSINSFCGLIKAILSAVIAIGIPIAVLFIVYAGFKFVLAQGNPEKLKEARKNLMYTLIGIGIFLGAWLLALVIANTVNSLGAGSTQSQIISCN